jgi:uncharacterized DUF497 family protein
MLRRLDGTLWHGLRRLARYQADGNLRTAEPEGGGAQPVGDPLVSRIVAPVGGGCQAVSCGRVASRAGLAREIIGGTIKGMHIEFDPGKRDKTLAERDLDFVCAGDVFDGHHFTAPDLRQNYGEDRYITVGRLEGRMVVMVWTPRGAARRIISMRKANDREQARYQARLD